MRNQLDDLSKFLVMRQLQSWRDEGVNKGIGLEDLTTTVNEILGLGATQHNIKHLVKMLGHLDYYSPRAVRSATQQALAERLASAENRIHALEFCYNRLVEQLSTADLVDVNITRCLDDE